jgi:hypothetical protein
MLMLRAGVLCSEHIYFSAFESFSILLSATAVTAAQAHTSTLQSMRQERHSNLLNVVLQVFSSRCRRAGSACIAMLLHTGNAVQAYVTAALRAMSSARHMCPNRLVRKCLYVTVVRCCSELSAM